MHRLLILTGCNRCEKLKSSLDSLNIKYDLVNCDSDPSYCDSVEDFTGTSSYPICLKLDYLGNIVSVAYIAESYDQVGINTTLDGEMNLLGFHSIDQLINYVIKS